jgi:hypothetical protein
MKMNGVKGQGAMEYILTYAWAILVIMLVGITIWQLGIFNMGSTSETTTGFSKIKPQLAATGVTADGKFTGVFTNGAGTKITIRQVVVKDKETGNVLCCACTNPPVGYTACAGTSGNGATPAGDAIVSVGGVTTQLNFATLGTTIASGDNFEVKLGSNAPSSYYECLVPGAKKGSVYNVQVEIGYDVYLAGSSAQHTDTGTIRGAIE